MYYQWVQNLSRASKIQQTTNLCWSTSQCWAMDEGMRTRDFWWWAYCYLKRPVSMSSTSIDLNGLDYYRSISTSSTSAASAVVAKKKGMGPIQTRIKPATFRPQIISSANVIFIIPYCINVKYSQDIEHFPYNFKTFLTIRRNSCCWISPP